MGWIHPDDWTAAAQHIPAASWERLRHARLFITGGTGWLGRNLLAFLLHGNRALDLDLSITALSRDPAAFLRQAPEFAACSELAFLAGDVRDLECPPHARFSHVIHAATTTAAETFNGADSLDKFDLLVDGTRRVLALTEASGARNLLFLSSGAAASASDGAPMFSEDSLSAPLTTDSGAGLGHGKRAAEYLCAASARRHGWHASLARCFSFVGPHMPLDLHYAAGNFIRDALAGHPITVQGDGTPVRSYLYTGDLMVWLLALLTREGPPRLFNVGSDRGITIADLAHLVRDALAPDLPVRILAAPPPGHAMGRGYLPCIDRARSELGLDAWTGLPEAIRRTAASAQLVPHRTVSPPTTIA